MISLKFNGRMWAELTRWETGVVSKSTCDYNVSEMHYALQSLNSGGLTG